MPWQQTRLHAFPDTACPGPRGSLVPPLPTVNPARKKRSCHCTHSMRCCTCCLCKIRWKTHFRLPTKFHLLSPTLDSLGSPFSIFPLLKSIPISSFFRNYVQGDERTLLEDINREEEGTDVSFQKRGWRSHCPAPSPAPSEKGGKRAPHAARTWLAHSIPWMMCVNTHHPLDPSKPNALPDRLLPQTSEEANSSHWRTHLLQSTSGRDL